jgi:hypothetical protein
VRAEGCQALYKESRVRHASNRRDHTPWKCKDRKIEQTKTEEKSRQSDGEILALPVLDVLCANQKHHVPSTVPLDDVLCGVPCCVAKPLLKTVPVQDRKE